MNNLNTSNEEHTIKNKKHKFKFQILIIPSIISICIIGYLFFQHINSRMPKNHVYVCDNPEIYSDFDNWIKNDLNCTWVPSYVIIHDGYVIGIFNGDCDKADFAFNLNIVMSQDTGYVKVPDYEIENLNGTRVKADKLFSSGFYVLEVHWIDCTDCQHQDENYTHDIYYEYSTARFYRYYIKSDRTKVEEKYK